MKGKLTFKPYTANELKEIVLMRSKGVAKDVIGKKFGRTPQAINTAISNYKSFAAGRLDGISMSKQTLQLAKDLLDAEQPESATFTQSFPDELDEIAEVVVSDTRSLDNLHRLEKAFQAFQVTLVDVIKDEANLRAEEKIAALRAEYEASSQKEESKPLGFLEEKWRS